MASIGGGPDQGRPKPLGCGCSCCSNRRPEPPEVGGLGSRRSSPDLTLARAAGAPEDDRRGSGVVLHDLRGEDSGGGGEGCAGGRRSWGGGARVCAARRDSRRDGGVGGGFEQREGNRAMVVSGGVVAGGAGSKGGGRRRSRGRRTRGWWLGSVRVWVRCGWWRWVDVRVWVRYRAKYRWRICMEAPGVFSLSLANRNRGRRR